MERIHLNDQEIHFRTREMNQFTSYESYVMIHVTQTWVRQTYITQSRGCSRCIGTV